MNDAIVWPTLPPLNGNWITATAAISTTNESTRLNQPVTCFSDMGNTISAA
jgi:hypothetical protein